MQDTIEAIKKVLDGPQDVVIDDYFQPGIVVKIQHGRFVGIEGVIFEKRVAKKDYC